MNEDLLNICNGKTVGLANSCANEQARALENVVSAMITVHFFVAPARRF